MKREKYSTNPVRLMYDTYVFHISILLISGQRKEVAISLPSLFLYLRNAFG